MMKFWAASNFVRYFYVVNKLAFNLMMLIGFLEKKLSIVYFNF